jgi:hypothetical protein
VFILLSYLFLVLIRRQIRVSMARCSLFLFFTDTQIHLPSSLAQHMPVAHEETIPLIMNALMSRPPQVPPGCFLFCGTIRCRNRDLRVAALHKLIRKGLSDFEVLAQADAF